MISFGREEKWRGLTVAEVELTTLVGKELVELEVVTVEEEVVVGVVLVVVGATGVVVVCTALVVVGTAAGVVLVAAAVIATARCGQYRCCKDGKGRRKRRKSGASILRNSQQKKSNGSQDFVAFVTVGVTAAADVVVGFVGVTTAEVEVGKSAVGLKRSTSSTSRCILLRWSAWRLWPVPERRFIWWDWTIVRVTKGGLGLGY